MKLHVGGHEAHQDWKILNVQNRQGVDYLGDIEDLSQFKDGSVEAVYASHVLEHVRQQQMLATVKGIHRILAPGGQFYCSVPDLDVLCHAFINPLIPAKEKLQVMRMMFGGQTDEYDFHYFGFCQSFVFEFLRQAGFSSWQRVKSFGFFNDSSDHAPFGFPISLNVIATK